MRPWMILLLTIGEVLSRPNQGRVSEQGGGTPSDAHEYTWLVTIQKRMDDGQWKHICGGAVIPSVNGSNESSVVLTAAHCITKFYPDMWTIYEDFSKIRVVFGSYLHSIKETGEENRSVSDMKYFPDWNFKLHGSAHDIALILINEPVKFTDTIMPILLPAKCEILQEGTSCTIAGWGLISDTVIPDQPYDMNVTIINSNKCADSWSHVGNVKYNSSVMYCASPSDDLPSACDGDSGSPLICKGDQWTAHGVTSFAELSCGRFPSKPSGYAMIEPYIDWIIQQIREWSL